MATIGYNEGYYSRSKWNDLAFQAEVIVTAVSSAQAQGSLIISGSSVISAVSDASVVGTKNLFRIFPCSSKLSVYFCRTKT